MIYLDNAASSHPKPAEVLRAVSDHLRENGANPGRSGHEMAMSASRKVYSARKTLAETFGTEPETVLFTANTTDAINRALKGFLRKGDKVLISDLEHNSVLRPLEFLKEEIGIRYETVKTGNSDEETAERFRNALTADTALVLFTHASNVTGRILPLREIGEICKENGVLFGADCAQTAGTENLNLKEDPVDFLCMPGHKCLLGPQGTGALILKEPRPMTPMLQGGTGYDSLSPSQPETFPEGYESGTLNTPGIVGLEAGVRFAIKHRTFIRRHTEDLRNLFVEEVRKIPGYTVLGAGDRFVGTVSILPPRGHSEELAQWLNARGICVRGGYHCSALAHRTLGTEATGAVRISFGYRNTEQDVAECIKYLKKY